MGILRIVRTACRLLAVLLVAAAVAGAIQGGDDDVVWALFLVGLTLWGAGGAAGALARHQGTRARRA